MRTRFVFLKGCRGVEMSKIYKECKTFDRKTSNCVTTGKIAGLRPGIRSQGMKDEKNWVSLSP